MSGSMLARSSLETGSSPDGSVLFVLSMYIGLQQESTLYKLSIIAQAIQVQQSYLYMYIHVYRPKKLWW